VWRNSTRRSSARLEGLAALLLVAVSCGDSAKRRNRGSDDGAGEGGSAESGGTGNAGGVVTGGRGGTTSAGTAGNVAGTGGRGDAGSATAGTTGASGGATGASGGTTDGGTSASAGEGGESGEGGEGATGGSAGGPNVLEPLPNCARVGWCWENPIPGGTDLRSIWVAGPDDAWAVGNTGLILRYDGERWWRMPTPSMDDWVTVWGSGPNDVWLGGSGVFRWNGTSWEEFTTLESVIDIHGTGPDNVRFSTGWEAIPYFDGTELHSPNGQAGFDQTVHTIYTLEPNEVYGAGSAATFIRATGNGDNGYHAELLRQFGGGVIMDLWGTTSDEWLWGVGEGGAIYRGRGGTWVEVETTTPQTLNGVWGSSQTDIWAVGNVGTILHYDGVAWTAETPFVAADFYDVGGTGPNDVWIVGTDGLIFHNDGGGWTAPTSLTTEELVDVHGTSDDDVWAVGARGTLLHRDENGWSLVPNPIGVDLYAVWAAGPNDVWISAYDQHIYHYDGETFEERYTSIVQSTFFGLAPDRIWSSGGGEIHFFDGQSWAPVEKPFPSSGDIWTASANELWVSQGSVGYYHLQDGVWTEVGSPRIGLLWGAGPNDLYSCYDYPGNSFIRWNGEEWQSLGGSVRVSNPQKMHGNATDNLWIVGLAGQTYNWDGTTLTKLTENSQGELDASLYGVWVSPTGRVYAVGASGTILTFESGKPAH
jgi:hypothetical protein